MACIFFLKFRLWNRVYTIANFYIPNYDQITAITQYLHLLTEFAEGTILVGGDFNMVLEPQLDTSSQQSNISYSRLRALKKEFGHRLLDLWRILNPKKWDYTYYSPVHQSYCRLDYFFTGTQLLEWNPIMDIGSFIWSDHSPLFLTVQPPQIPRSDWSWRLNETLMQDPLCHQAVLAAIKNFIADHEHDETPLPIQWEALKAVVRGLFIQHGARLKKERSATIQDDLSKLRVLEISHKKTPTPELLAEISLVRSSLLQSLEVSHCKSQYRYALGKYRYGDKAGRSLSRSLHPRPQ